MKPTAIRTVVILLAAVLVWGGLPAERAVADDSTGVAISVGLAAAVAVVYGLVSLRSDIERYSQAEMEEVIARAAREAERSPVVLEALTAPMDFASPEAEVAGAAIGWRVGF